MEEFKSVCQSPWCRAPFFYKENEMISVGSDELKKQPPKHCKKCQSFSTELSGGVEWKDKEYEGSRFDNLPHEIKYKVTNFRL